MQVGDQMTRTVLVAKVSRSAREMHHQMEDLGIRHMPVIDEGGQVVGMLSDRDLRLPAWAIERAPGLDLPEDLSVGDVMTPLVLTVEPNDPLGKAASILLRSKVGAMPVTKPDGSLCGILSVVDVIRAYIAFEEGSSTSSS